MLDGFWIAGIPFSEEKSSFEKRSCNWCWSSWTESAPIKIYVEGSMYTLSCEWVFNRILLDFHVGYEWGSWDSEHDAGHSVVEKRYIMVVLPYKMVEVSVSSTAWYILLALVMRTTRCVQNCKSTSMRGRWVVGPTNKVSFRETPLLDLAEALNTTRCGVHSMNG